MSAKHSHIIYSAEDIRRYLAGDMSNDEMHAIEKAALDDPLLADAIEGYATTEEQDFSGMLAQLKKDIAGNADTPIIAIKRSTFKWWKAAAAVLLVGTTATIAYMMNGKKEQPSIAKHENAPVLDSAVTQLIKADSVDEKTVAVNEPVKEEKYLSSTLARPTTTDELNRNEKKKANVNDDFVYVPTYKSSADSNKDKSVTYDVNNAPAAEEKETAVQPAAPTVSNAAGNTQEGFNYNDVQNKQAAAKPPTVIGYNSQGVVNNLNKNYQFKGFVVNKKGEPISFATLKLSTPNKQLIVADANGSFTVAALDSIVTAEVASAGFEPGKFKLSANSNNALTLYSSDKALSEVVITSNIPKDKLAKKRVSSVDEEPEETAEPSGGWESYNEYLNTNVHVPSNNQSNIGTVEAIVKVNRKGEVDDVKITQSLNSDCDKEAVRLIKKGPGWKLKSGKKGYGKVKIQFNQ